MCEGFQNSEKRDADHRRVEERETERERERERVHIVSYYLDVWEFFV